MKKEKAATALRVAAFLLLPSGVEINPRFNQG